MGKFSTIGTASIETSKYVLHQGVNGHMEISQYAIQTF